MEVKPTFQSASYKTSWCSFRFILSITESATHPDEQKLKYMYIQHTREKVKQSLYRPGQALRVAGVLGSQISWHLTQEGGKVFSPTHRPPLPYPPQELFLVLIFVRGWIDPKVIARQEGLRQWKILVTPLGIETTTFQFVAKCLNQLRHRVPHNTLTLFFFKSIAHPDTCHKFILEDIFYMQL